MVQEMALRQRFNEKVRTKLGGLGEILATEVSPKGMFELGVVGTFMFSGLAGCTGMGAAMSTSDDPRTRLIGTLMYHEEAHKDRMKEAREGRSEVNVYQGGDNVNQKQIYTVEIINLDINRVEVEMIDDLFSKWDYFMYKIDSGNFPEKGYMLIRKKNGIAIKTYLRNKEEDKERNKVCITDGKGECLYGKDLDKKWPGW